MTDPDYIESRLSIQTNAMVSNKEVTNNRYHYHMIFDENIGWDWIEAQIEKVSAEVECTLEPYKMGPANSFILIEIRELQRRKDIDDDQHSLEMFNKE